MQASRWRTTLTSEGWYYLCVLAFVLAGAIMREINLMLVLAGMMIGPILFNWRAARLMLRSLQVERRLPDAIAAGDLVTVELVARSAHRAYGIRLEDPVERLDQDGNGQRVDGRAILPQVAPGAPVTTVYRVRFGQRGHYRLGPLQASSRYPLGLVCRSVAFPLIDEVIVHPRLGRLLPRWHQVYQEAFLGSRRAQHKQGMVEGDFYGVRDWRSGDSQRWIHWRTTARRGDLVVRQFELPRTQDLAILLDLWQPQSPTPDEIDDVELAVSFAATVAVHVCRRGGSQFTLASAAREPVVLHGAASASLARDCLRHLGVAAADSADHLAEAMTSIVEHLSPSTQVVLISTRPPQGGQPPQLEPWLGEPRFRAVLQRMRRIHVRDEEFFSLFSIE
jgi:uncharacterized protein (DUF58 family)